MAHFNLYKSSANWYVRIVHARTGKIWDNVASVFSLTPTWANTAIALTFSQYIGGHPVTIPALPTGDYDLLFYDAAAPASTDTVEIAKRLKWSNGSMSYAVQNLVDL
jgi:hypothetical protein